MQKIPFHSIAKTLPVEMFFGAFPCCNSQFAPFPEHAQWNVHICGRGRPQMGPLQVRAANNHNENQVPQRNSRVREDNAVACSLVLAERRQ